mmetsp:Transcript_88387/g.205639  ORF Transcript_88387/g.205639 Transcript_88387/m.205639 type:complete len:135 (-) Transcript_88387:415-819(-)
MPGETLPCSATRIWNSACPPRDCMPRMLKDKSCFFRHTSFWTTQARRVPSGTISNGQRGRDPGPPPAGLGSRPSVAPASLDVAVNEECLTEVVELSSSDRLRREDFGDSLDFWLAEWLDLAMLAASSASRLNLL